MKHAQHHARNLSKYRFHRCLVQREVIQFRCASAVAFRSGSPPPLDDEEGHSGDDEE
jgi:hypothetical protein